ncbi:Ger(x)C family spore germination protein [Ammoniphilus sp. 3BR4]|uniref:Ger(x)C family spore germination protein n=1 Tax=Ammoniphilus sp. 3BR4 TaxID=3158265 RepID=UPI00346616C6
MNRTCRIGFILILLIPLLTGCWNRRELNELAIVTAFAFDKLGDQYVVTAQVVNPGEVASQKGGTGGTPVSVYQEKAGTVFEAIRKMTTVAPRKLYGAHLRMLIIGEELAKEGIGETLDLFSREAEIRTDFYIVVSKGIQAKEILKVLTPMENIPANKMFSSLESSEKAWAPTISITLDELISNMVSEGKHPMLTGIYIKGEQGLGESKQNIEQIDSPAKLTYAGLAAFKKDKLMGWLNETESKGFSFIDDKVQSTIVAFPCPKGGKLGVEIIRSKTHVEGKVKQGKPEIDVKVRSEANVGDVECKDLDLTKTQTIYDLETRTEKEIQDQIEAVINKAQKKYKADIFGFGEAIHRADPPYWKKKKKNWDQTFSDLPVNVKVEVKIRRIGTVNNSFLKELKE